MARRVHERHVHVGARSSRRRQAAESAADDHHSARPTPTSCEFADPFQAIGAQALQQVVADTQRVGHRRERRVDAPILGKKLVSTT